MAPALRLRLNEPPCVKTQFFIIMYVSPIKHVCVAHCGRILCGSVVHLRLVQLRLVQLRLVQLGLVQLRLVQLRLEELTINPYP